jgi:hypothetical protein
MRALILGAIAGAAGTMALDVVSYADMAVRGRAASDMPAEVIRRLAAKAGITWLSIPSEETDEKLKNQRSALGALSGYAIGIGIGALYGAIALATAAEQRGTLLQASLLGALAMAASDVPANALGATDLRGWTPSSWASDIVPHAAYGMITASVFAALARDD